MRQYPGLVRVSEDLELPLVQFLKSHLHLQAARLGSELNFSFDPFFRFFTLIHTLFTAFTGKSTIHCSLQQNGTSRILMNKTHSNEQGSCKDK